MGSDSSSGSDSDSSWIKEVFYVINQKPRKTKKISEDERISTLSKLIREPGSNINVKDNHGNTLLHIAVKKGYEIIVDFLIKEGADLTVTNNKSETPIALAKRIENTVIIQVLEQHSQKHEESVCDVSSKVSEVITDGRRDQNIETSLDTRVLQSENCDNIRARSEHSGGHDGITLHGPLESEQHPMAVPLPDEFHPQSGTGSLLHVEPHSQQVTGHSVISVKTPQQEVENSVKLLQVGSSSDVCNRYENNCTHLQLPYISKSKDLWTGLDVDNKKFNSDSLKDNAFYSYLNITENIFFIQITISSDNKLVDDDIILSKLTTVNKPLLIQCQSKSNTKVYIKECDKAPVVIDLRSSSDELKEDVFTEMISSRDGFGLALIVEALKAGIVGNFDDQEVCNRSLTRVTFDVTKEFDMWKLIDYALLYDDFLSVRFLCLHQWDLSTGDPRTLEIAAEHANRNTLVTLFQLRFPFTDKDIVLSERKVNLLKLMNALGDNPLLISAKAGKTENVDFFIQCGADVTHRNHAGKSAMDLAWENKHYDVVLLLLERDSDLPDIQNSDFSMNTIDNDVVVSQKLRQFFDDRKIFLSSIKEGDLNTVKEMVLKSRVYLGNSRCKSEVLIHAITHEQYKIYAYLQSVSVNFKSELEQAERFKELSDSQKEKLQKEIDLYFSPVKDAHIMFLVSKSKNASPLLDKEEKFKTTVEQCYRDLDEIVEISNTLELIALSHSGLDGIIFDFDRESIIGTCTNSSHTTPGVTDFQAGLINIGAKGLEPGNTDVLGTLAHELTHFAMQRLFGNDYNPYRKSDESDIKKFSEIAEEIFSRISNHDPVIQNAFKNYEERDRHSELIVRVPHILAKYGKEYGGFKLQKETPALYEYFTETVLTSCKTYIQERHLIQPRSSMELLNPYLGVIDSIQQANIEFKNPYNLDGFLNQKHKQLYVLTTKHIWLSSCNVYQALKGTSQYANPANYLFLRPDQFQPSRPAIFNIYKTHAIALLVFKCPDLLDETELNTVLKELRKILSVKPDKKVIFIVHERYRNAIRKMIGDFGCILEERDEEFTLVDLIENIQNELLMKEVIFQGKEIQIGNLVEETVESKKLINSVPLVKLICDEKLFIGNEVPVSTGYNKEYYITRFFNQHIEIGMDFLKHNFESDLVAISGLDKSSLQALVSGEKPLRLFNEIDPDVKNPIRFIILNKNDDHENSFQYLCEQYSKRNIHWLSSEYGKLIWQKTRGDILQLVAFRIEHTHQIEDESKSYSEVSLLEQVTRSKVVIISDTAGMGKTTVLSSLSKQIKEVRPSLWVVRIDLNDYTSLFEEEMEYNKRSGATLDNGFKVVEFLMDKLLEFVPKLQLKTSLEKGLFKFSFDHPGRIVVLLDGFDEISPEYEDLVMTFVQNLKDTSVETIWITTRPYMRTDLEHKLGEFAYTLKPFSVDDQVEFLTKFWKQNVNAEEFDEQQSEHYAKALIFKLADSISDLGNELTGIPLQTRMLAESFEDDFRQGHLELPEKLDLIDLYERFVEKKYKIYQVEKNKMDTSKLGVGKDRKILYNRFRNDHRKSALTTLFNKQELELLLSDQDRVEVNDLIIDIKEGNERTGIIDQVIDNKPHFIHRTFAEYFAADFLSSNLVRNIRNEKVHKYLLTDFLIDAKHKVIRSFFNGQLSSKSIEKVDEIYPESIELRNENGKTILHVAVEESNAEIVRFILTYIKKQTHISEKFINITDRQDRTPLCRAVERGNLGIIISLTENGANIHFADNTKITMMHLAAYSGVLEVVQWLVNKGLVINSNDYIGRSVLHWAGEYNKWDVVHWLVDAGADINATSDDGQTVLHWAVQSDSIDNVISLVGKGANINSSGFTFGKSVLLWSTEIRKWDMVRWLVEAGGDVNSSDDDGNYVLKYVALFGEFDLVRLLVEKGGDINKKDNDGMSVIHAAARSGMLELVCWLIDVGVDIDSVDNSGKGILHWAASSGHVILVQWLLDSGVQIDVNDYEGKTPFLWAVAHGIGKWDIIPCLVGNGANVNVIDSSGKSALHYAAENGKWDLVKWLVEHSANINAIDKDKKTVLLCASEGTKWDVVQWLISNGSDVNAKDKGGMTVMHWWALTGDLEQVKWLLDNGSEVNPADDLGLTVLHWASNYGKMDVVKLLVCRGADSNATSTSGKTSLHLAAEFGHFDVVLLLVDAGADVSVKDSLGKSVLHFAARSGSMEMIQYLLGKRADVFGKDNCSRTVLHSATESGKVEVVQLLVEKGIHVGDADTSGKAALALAVEARDVDVAKYLIGRKANVNARDISGRTVLHFATLCQDLDMVTLLLENGSNAYNADNSGQSVVDIAIDSGNLHLITLLESEGTFVNVSSRTLHSAAASGEWDQVKLCISSKGVDVNASDEDGVRVLDWAARSGNLNVMSWLVDHGADLQARNNSGMSVLNSAIESGLLDVVQWLVNRGVDFRVKDIHGMTGLHWAAESGKLGMVEWFVDQGGDLLSRDGTSRTPLHWAAEAGALHVVEWMVDRGGDVTCKDGDDLTALDLARRGGYGEIVGLLERFL